MSNFIRRILLVISIGFFIIFGFLSWASRPAARTEKSKIFILKVYPKNKKIVKKIINIAKEQGYTGKHKKTHRIVKKKIGYQVVFYYDDNSALTNMADRLKSKKIVAKIKRDSDTGSLFIQGGGNFKSKKKALKMSKKLKSLTTFKFDVKQNYYRVKKKTKAVVIYNVKEDSVDRLKDLLSDYAKGKIDVIEDPSSKKSKINK